MVTTVLIRENEALLAIIRFVRACEGLPTEHERLARGKKLARLLGNYATTVEERVWAEIDSWVGNDRSA
jgi:hypothetical protein